MGYSIADVAEHFDISAHTIRFYEKAGLLPFVGRNDAGNREFVDADLRLLQTILCLKDTGMKLKEIRQYIAWVMDGPTSVAQRRQLMKEHREAVVQQIRELKDNLAQIDAKLEIYESPNAAKIVRQQLRNAAAERKRQGLCTTASMRGNGRKEA